MFYLDRRYSFLDPNFDFIFGYIKHFRVFILFLLLINFTGLLSLKRWLLNRLGQQRLWVILSFRLRLLDLGKSRRRRFMLLCAFKHTDSLWFDFIFFLNRAFWGWLLLYLFFWYYLDIYLVIYLLLEVINRWVRLLRSCCIYTISFYPNNEVVNNPINSFSLKVID